MLKWICFLKRLDNYLENINQVVIICFVLHNICQVSGDVYLNDDCLIDHLIRQEREQRRLEIQQRYTIHPIPAYICNALKIHANNNVWNLITFRQYLE